MTYPSPVVNPGQQIWSDITELELFDRRIQDFSPLAGLVNLQELVLCDTQVQDISPLAGLVNLEYLDLNRTQVSEPDLLEFRITRPLVRIVR